MKNKMPMTRSENMRRIKSENTSIEQILRKALFAAGVRYRKNCKDVFGKPDICIKKYKFAVFCDSEFWHGKFYLEGKIPKSNREYWTKKLERNIQRDKEVNTALKGQGWTILRFWEKDIRKNTKECVEAVLSILKEHNEYKKT